MPLLHKTPFISTVPEKDVHLTAHLTADAPSGTAPSRRPPSPRPSSATRPRLRAAPPKFYAVPHDRVAEEGETVRFQCAVSGHPDPFVRWERDGREVTTTSRVRVTEREDLKVLEISDVKPEDSGVYKVVLENSLGKVEASARLEVIRHRAVAARGLRARSSSPRPGYRRTYDSLSGSSGR